MLMLTAAIALLMACGAFVVYELVTHRVNAANELVLVGHLVGANTSAALALGDEKDALEALQSLRTESRFVGGCLYRRSGEVLASYWKSGTQGCPPAEEASQPRRSGRDLESFQEVQFRGDRVGTLYLRSELTDLITRVRQYSAIGLGLLSAAFLITYLVSSRLQRLVSDPILHLAETASRVSEDHNYAVRAKKEADDEIGILVDSFNEMMATIESSTLALLDGHNDLDQRVRNRTIALENEIAERQRTQEDLLAAKQAAEASSVAKSRFLANMSHELRTPLNAIIGYGELLEEEARDDGRMNDVRDLGRIHASARHLLAVINDVLDISKIEAGKTALHWETFDVASMALEAVSTMEPMARDRGNRLNLVGEGLQGTMTADLTKFRQSLLNLLSNACKFTERGLVTLEVCREQSEGAEWMLWKVRDTGIGIAPEHQNRLFQAFSQVDNSETRKFGGTGLGLAISQKFCQMMGGEIRVWSAPGQGSEFTLRLPALPEVDDA